MKKIIITGYRPFSGVVVNPSQIIVQRICENRQPSDTEVIPRLIDVSYNTCDQEVEKIVSLKPDAVISFGVNASAEKILLERFCLNIDDSETPDNSGEIRKGMEIEHGMPAAFRNTLPLNCIKENLSSEGVPVAFSNHAGAFLCNHIFFRLAALSIKHGYICGFIHVPPISSTFTEELLHLSAEIIMKTTRSCLTEKH